MVLSEPLTPLFYCPNSRGSCRGKISYASSPQGHGLMKSSGGWVALLSGLSLVY
jgi:hypothetical protein